MTLRERLGAEVSRTTQAPPDVLTDQLCQVVADWLRERSADGLASEAKLTPRR
jgi:hypothetical protein